MLSPEHQRLVDNLIRELSMTIDPGHQPTREAIDRAQAGELLSGSELAAIFRIKHAQFHNLMKAGQFDQFLVKPAVGNKCYSGVKVYRYLCGDPVYEPTFGRKRRPARGVK
jgi:hypothetical protein